MKKKKKKKKKTKKNMKKKKKRKKKKKKKYVYALEQGSEAGTSSRLVVDNRHAACDAGTHEGLRTDILGGGRNSQDRFPLKGGVRQIPSDKK